MGKRLRVICGIIAFLFTTPLLAEMKWRHTLQPYIGADAEWRHLNFKKGYGDNLFKHNFPQGNIYAGIKLNEYVGIEAGYEITAKKTRNPILGPGDTVAGYELQATTFQYITSAHIKGSHINLLTFTPITIADTYKFRLIALVGLAHLEAKFKRATISENGVLLPPLPFYFARFSTKKNVLRLGGGLEHMLTENWGIRAMVKWENTRRLISYEQIKSILYLHNKNSILYSLGAFTTF